MALTIRMRIDDDAEHQYFFATGDGSQIELIPLVVTANGEYIPDTGKAYNRVVVSVPATQLDELIATTNGTYNAPDGHAYNVVRVNVEALLEDQTAQVTENGTYEYTPTEQYDGLSKVTVTVNVPNTYTQSDEGKVVDNGALVSQSTRTVTQNGTYDTTKNNSTVVNVPNPSTGTINITQNGTYDVTEKASANVNVPNPSTGTINITQNGTYDVTEKASADVNVPNTYTQSDEGKVVDNGGLVSQTTRSVTQNGTYDTTKNNSTVVNVPNTYTQSDEGKVVDNGALVAQTSRNVTVNGTYDTTKNNETVVNVPNTYTQSDEGKVVDNGTLVAQTSRTVTVNGTYNTKTNNEVVVNVPTPVQDPFVVRGTFTAGTDTTQENYSPVIDLSSVPTGKVLKGFKVYADGDWTTLGLMAGSTKNYAILYCDCEKLPSSFTYNSQDYTVIWTSLYRGTTANSASAGANNLDDIPYAALNANVRYGFIGFTATHQFEYFIFVARSKYGLFPGITYKYELYFS